jgi:hypothetical protein
VVSQFRDSSVSHAFRFADYGRSVTKNATPKTPAPGTRVETSTGKTSTPKTSTPKTSTPKTSTPWGPATLVERVRLQQQAGDRRFASHVELLENDRGERLLRFAYSTDGTVRRGPVTLRERDLARLRREILKSPALADALGEAFERAGDA